MRQYLYKNELITLYSLLEYSKNILSRFPFSRELNWHIKCSILIFKLALDSVGLLLSSLPDSPINSQFKSFNPAIIASQGRIMIDHYISIKYLLENKNEEMLIFHELIWNQAIDFKRWNIVNNFNPNNPFLHELKERLKQNEEKIKNHPLFETLDKNMQNNCALGSSDKTHTRNQIIERSKLNSTIFWALDNHFSQFVHSTAFSTDQLALIGENLDESLQFITHLVKDIIGLFSLIILEFSYSFNIPEEDVPLGILNTLVFWQDFFQGNFEEKNISNNSNN